MKTKISMIIDQFHASIKTLHHNEVIKLEKRIKDQKTYLNMVVHDLRNPGESIYQGL